jgi:enoyl-CoA hydratase
MLLQKPVIAAISGHAVAGGLELALWCDLRIMEEDAVLGVFCRRWGVPLIDGGTVRLPRLIGLSRALDLILTGRPVEAAEALSFGLANRVVPTGTSREAAEKLAHHLAQFPQICMRNDRLSAYEQFGLRIDEALDNEFKRGLSALKEESISGAERFSSGAGRHGKF